MREHQKNAFAVARFLETSPHVTEVLYPGLPSHPQHELANRQCRGYSGMVSFRIKGTLENAKKFLESLKVRRLRGFGFLYSWKLFCCNLVYCGRWGCLKVSLMVLKGTTSAHECQQWCSRVPLVLMSVNSGARGYI